MTTTEMPSGEIGDEGIQEFVGGDETEVNEEPAQQQQQAKPTRDTTIEVDGRQYTVTEKTLKAYNDIPPDVELTDREYKSLLSSYKQAIHFNNATREAKNQKSQIDKFVEMMETNPKETLKQMFASKDKELIKIAEELLMEQIETEMLDPKERELKQLREEKERYAKQLEEQQKQYEQQKLDAETQEYMQKFEQEIITILESNPRLAKQEATIMDLANIKNAAYQRGVDVSFNDVSKEVEKKYKNITSTYLQNSTIEEIFEMLGDKMKEIRKHDLSKVKQMGNPLVQASQSSPSGSKKPTSITPDEFREQAMKRLASAMR